MENTLEDEFRIPCPKCGSKKSWKRSQRKHKKPGRFFVVCKNCGYESQATKSGPFNTNPAKNRAEPITTHMVSARLTDDEFNLMIKSGKNAHQIIQDWLLTNVK